MQALQVPGYDLKPLAVHPVHGMYREDKQNIIQAQAEVREHVAEGNVIIFEAPQRWGKTLGATIWAVDSYKCGREIYSTIEFKFPHKKLDFYKMKLSNDVSPLLNAHLFVDELNFYLDARAAMSKVNREFSSFLLQVKKQGLLVTGTTHALKYLELRFRENYDYRINPQVFPKYPGTPKIIRMKITNGPTQKKMSKVVTMECGPYLKLYNTLNVYNPFSSIPSKQPKNPIIPPLPQFKI